MAQIAAFLTPSQVARRLGVSAETTRDWARTGKIRAVRTPGGRYRIPVEAVEAVERGETVAAA